jgi:hypothetical protein
MPSRGNITLPDGESTPINHVFVPDGDVSPNHARFINVNASVPAASEFAFVSVQRSTARAEDYSTPGKKVAPNRCTFRLLYPSTYVEAVSGLTLVDFIDEYIWQSLCHPRSSVQRRENGRTLSAGMMNSTTWGVSVHDPMLPLY